MKDAKLTTYHAAMVDESSNLTPLYRVGGFNVLI
jgi:hypothetical protein